MIINPLTSKETSPYIEKKLIWRLRIFFFLFFILIDIIVLEISLGYVPWYFAVMALLIGSFSGLLFSRRKKIYWEAKTSKVIARMDKLGVVLLIVYIIFAILRHRVLHGWFSGSVITAISLCFAAGGMISRVWIMRRQIKKILKNQKLI